MTPRQCEIAAESHGASLLAQAGYDVLVQYGPHQPHYDLVAVRQKRILLISVKGSQDGGWLLAPKHRGRTYHDMIDAWETRQRSDVIFFLVQFWGVSIGRAPRCHVAKPAEIAAQMKAQRQGRGYGALFEHRVHRRAGSTDHLPVTWKFSQNRIDSI
jgi:hypothetical protein